jgi:hypothetical protein
MAEAGMSPSTRNAYAHKIHTPRGRLGIVEAGSVVIVGHLLSTGWDDTLAA